MVVEIRHMDSTEVEPALKLFSGFGLNESLSIAESYRKQCPENFFVAVNQGQRSETVIGACASPITSEGSGFLGLYVVDKHYQGQGIGVKLFQSCMNSLNGANCGLSAVPEKYSIYKNKAGFKIDGGSSLMIFKHSPIELSNLNDSTAQLLPNYETKIGYQEYRDHDYLSELVKFDASIHKYSRETLLRNQITSDDTNIVGVVDTSQNNRVIGYGMIRKDITGASMPGPVYALKPEIGEFILGRLFRSTTEHAQNAQNGNIAIYCNSSAEYGMTLMKDKLGMNVVEECRKLYTKFVPKFEYSNLYVCHTPDFDC